MAAMQLQHEQDVSSSISSKKRLKLKLLAKMVGGVMSDDKKLQLKMMTHFRKLLSKTHKPPINEVVKSGVVPRFVQFLSHDDFPRLQWEATKALTNIASGKSKKNKSKVIIESGAIPLFIKLLRSPKQCVRQQAVLTLGKVARDSPQCRDFVLSHGAMLSLLILFNNNHLKPYMLRIATWTLSTFCSTPQLPLDQRVASLVVLQRLLHSTDEQVLMHACSALSHLSHGTYQKIQTVIDSGVIPRLIQLLAHPSPLVLSQALNTIANIVRGDDMQKQTLLNYHPLPGLLDLLTNTNYNNNKSIQKHTCWTISNITAGNTSQIQEVIQSGIISPLIHLLQQGEFDIKIEALRAISKAIAGGNHDQIKFLVSQGCIKPLCDLLTCPDPRVVTVSLERLENILKVGEAEKNIGNTGDYNLYAHLIDEAQGLKKIENLQSDDNKKIKEKAVQILKAFWSEDDFMVCDDVREASESNGFQNGAAAPTGGALSSLLEKLFVKFYI